MIIPDINLLLYANFSAYPDHVRARSWWEELLNGDEDVAIPGPTLFGFVRLATNRKLFDPPMSVELALTTVEGWLARPNVRFLLPGPRHLEIAFDLLRRSGASGNLTTDTQLAAMAIEYQAEMHSNDQDFGRFSQLRWVNPLAQAARTSKP
ncbi:type II toxin-antitoxin system VapC family toxin [Pendulispora brunnea]|uniref:Ribonuclease VapC n=1 Tax=Pendulispora brunnea TaxID=2905690 RepID=A0ABZ2KU88_9BACT